MQNCEMQHQNMVKNKENLHTEHCLFAPLEFIVTLFSKFTDQKKNIAKHIPNKNSLTNKTKRII